MALVLVGGGARSGKSRWALERARKRGGRLVYIATAEALDEEMSLRIARHRADRGYEFETIEEPVELARAIRSSEGDAIVVDCLTLWLSNGMCDVEGTLTAAKEQSAEVIVVTNEVGCGIVPENALAREFRDRAGIVNQRFAEAADEVYWMVFGQALRVK
ncbi:MAG: bifunctional adenosylcobinamide kinase/adenosylcobinamide-phosphate guanylyltransferase [Bryobacterales bacterium]|nr:bifunctional adenosylcobinamide kinase/adenosylcobinamide-phosphate guanylyltransferase [Bryobacterales bacterium]